MSEPVMSTDWTSRRSTILAASMQAWKEYYTQSTWSKRRHEPGTSDFTFATSHEMPLTGVVSALQEWSTPLNKDWFAQKTSDPIAQSVIASSLGERLGVSFDADDIMLTNGGSAAIAVGLRAVADPGDEVIVCSPARFNYQLMIHAAGMIPVCVDIDATSFNLDLEAISAAITARTRIVIVNTPHDPTGKVYAPETLERLARLLQQFSSDRGRPIYLLSDESYSGIVFDKRRSYSPTEFYPNTLLTYGYSKILLSPGQRIGFIAVPSSMPYRDQIRESIFTTQIALGWSFPNALLQHALPTLDGLSIDIEHLQRKRDRLVLSLRQIGYRLHVPEGTFYVLPRSPIGDDIAFAELLASNDVFVLPGSMLGIPEYFRISLTATDEMIERSLSGFAAAYSASGSETSQRGMSLVAG